MTRVPDYRGLFLRGQGSRSFSQNNGSRAGNTSRSYSSGSLGQIQGDATMEWTTASEMEEGNGGSSSSVRNSVLNSYRFAKEVNYVEMFARAQLYNAVSPDSIGGHGSPLTSFGTNRAQEMIGSYTYELNFSTSADAEGNEHIDSIELIPTWHDAFMSGERLWEVVFSNSTNIPTANEIRPINTAVRYFIKAR